jgi:propionyl-CoA synthetase
MPYADVYRRSLEDPNGFWADAAQDIDWYEPPTKILDDSRSPFTRWFVGGTLNTCHNALDRHVDGASGNRADQVALIYDCIANCATRSRSSRASSEVSVCRRATAS